MYNFYSKEEIEILREGGKRLEMIMRDLESFIKPGLKVSEIDEKALELIKEYEAEPATVGYSPKGAPFPFPSAVCVSIDDGIAHGISTNNPRVLKEGEVLSADIVIKYKGLFVDTCRT
jgi:methionyl aminopeptidase